MNNSDVKALLDSLCTHKQNGADIKVSITLHVDPVNPNAQGLASAWRLQWLIEVSRGQRLIGEGKFGLFYTGSINVAEVIAHGDDVVSTVAPFLGQSECLFAVGVIAGFVVGNEHESCGAMTAVAQAVVVHGTVAAAVAERQHGHLANLLRRPHHPDCSTQA